MIGTTNADGSGVDNEELTAYRENVLNNKLFLGYESDEPLTGTMTDNGTTENQTLNCGSSFTVKRGYHAKEFKINANSLASQTSGNASAAQILKDKVAWINGQRVVGTMPDQGAKNISLKSGDSWTILKGFHNGSGKITVATLASQTPGNASASNILTGKTAWVNGSKITGNIPTMGGQTITPSSSQQTVSTSGKYLNGNIIVKSVSPPPANCIKKGYTYMGVTGTWQGYVASPTDLYFRGNNPGGLNTGNLSNPLGKLEFNSGQLNYQMSHIGTSQSLDYQMIIFSGKPYDLSGYHYLNIEMKVGYFSGSLSPSKYRINLYATNSTNYAYDTLLYSENVTISNNTFTLPMYFNEQYITKYLALEVKVTGEAYSKGIIYRIWLS